MTTTERSYRVADSLPSTRADADGLIDSLGRGLKLLGIENISDKASVLGVGDRKPILVGGGTDGAYRRAQWYEGETTASSPLATLDVVLCTSAATIPSLAHCSTKSRRCYSGSSTSTTNLPKSHVS